MRSQRWTHVHTLVQTCERREGACGLRDLRASPPSLALDREVCGTAESTLIQDRVATVTKNMQGKNGDLAQGTRISAQRLDAPNIREVSRCAPGSKQMKANGGCLVCVHALA